MTDRTETAGCRTALVTGGTSGLGLAMAGALAGAGLRVAVAGRSGERAEQVAGLFPGRSALSSMSATRSRRRARSRRRGHAWTASTCW